MSKRERYDDEKKIDQVNTYEYDSDGNLLKDNLMSEPQYTTVAKTTTYTHVTRSTICRTPV